MPVYNTEKFLRRSIESILAQTFSDWELILVDDGSKDNSGAVCEEFALKDDRIIVIHKENGGAGSARNKGLEIACGEYVVFPDSDDWIDKEAYAYCVKMMEENRTDMILFGSVNTVYDNDNNILSEVKGRLIPCSLRTQIECREKWAELMNTEPMYGPSDKVYKLSIIRDNNLWFPDLRRMQDGVFNMLYYNCISSFAVIDKYYYHFTLHSTEYQKKKIPKDFIECAITFHKTAISLLEDWEQKTEKNECIIGNWFSEIVILAQTEYLPNGESCNFSGLYHHIRSINNNRYIHTFYRRYGKIHQLRKMEKAIKFQMNFLLALLALITIERK